MKIKIAILIFSLGFLTQPLMATNPISLESYEAFENREETKSKKMSLLTKAKQWFKAKMVGIMDGDRARKLGIASLILGLLALISLFSAGVIGSAGPILMVFFALAGDIISIMVLWQTRKEKKENKLARRFAWWGLITSLLAGLLPLSLLILVLLTL